MHNLAGLVATAIYVIAFSLLSTLAHAQNSQERLPWERAAPAPTEDPYAPNARSEGPRADQRYGDEGGAARAQPAPRYQPQPAAPYQSPPGRYAAPQFDDQRRHAAPYDPGDERGRRYDDDDDRFRDQRRYRSYDDPQRAPGGYADVDRNRRYDEERHSYSESEIVATGHRFFGKLSKGLAKAIEHAFRSQGRPTGYILGEDAGGAFVAGLRYGEGYLHTKFGDRRKVFWQGPSIGYDFGGEGSRTMVLVYNLDRPGQLFRRFGGVQGSAYVIGGASVQLLKSDDITLAPIRTGVGLRLGANVGYLKYTRRPTWNPF